jgi:hypothetical protein
MSDEFPAELASFIDQHVKSLAELETLLLLRQNAEQSWTAAEVAKALYTSAETCARQLADLARRGFFARSEGESYRYHPVHEDLDRLLGKLADIYQERRVTVITLIYSKPRSTAQTLADAFRVRKED